MKVVRIWHAAVVAEYRKKIRALVQFSDLDLTLVIPQAWREGGQEASYVYNEKIDRDISTIVGRIRHQNNVRRYFFLTGLWQTLARVRPHIIDLEEEPFAYVTAQVLLYRKLQRLDAKLIFQTAENIRSKMSPSFERIRNRAYAESSAALVRNREAEFHLRQRGFAGPILMTGNGIDLDYFSPGRPEQLRESLGLNGRRVIGFVGKLKTGKGVLTLLDAFSGLPDDPVLLMVGDGHLHDEIDVIAKSRGIRDRLILTGAVDHSETPHYYRLMDVCVLPSQTEGRWKEAFGRTLIEAMACGVPVIGSSSGAIPETIDSAGLTFPEKDAEQLAERIRELFRDQELYAACKRAGFERARNFSWEAVAKTNYEAYQTVLNGVTRPNEAHPVNS
jgi:glycosyltransferase involved in cell wall biosynthesis